jgi:hypothetical protein
MSEDNGGGWATLYDPHPVRRFVLRVARYLGLIPGYPEPDDALDVDLTEGEHPDDDQGPSSYQGPS